MQNIYKGIIIGLVIGATISATFFILTGNNSDTKSTIDNLRTELSTSVEQNKASNIVIGKLEVENNRLAKYQQQYTALTIELEQYEQRSSEQLRRGQEELTSLIQYQWGAESLLTENVRIVRQLTEGSDKPSE